MPTPEDRSFFENLNKDLATALSTAISGSLKNIKVSAPKMHIENVRIDSESLKKMGLAIGRAVGDEVSKSLGGRGGSGGDGAPPPSKGGPASPWSKFEKTTKALLAVATATRLLAAGTNALLGIFSHLDTIATGAAATNQMQLVGSQALSKSMGRFGADMPMIGQMMEATMRAGNRNITKGLTGLMVRTKGFGASVQGMAQLTMQNTNVLGMTTDASQELGHDIIDLAHANGIYADSILEAVNAMIDFSRDQAVVFGPEVAGEFRDMLAMMAGAGVGLEAPLRSFMQKVGAPDWESMIQRQKLGGILPSFAGGRGFDPTDLQADPKKYVADIIQALAAVKPEDKSTASYMFTKLKPMGLGLGEIAFARRMMKAATEAGVSIHDYLSGAGLSLQAREKMNKKVSDNILGTSIKALKNSAKFAGQLEAMDTVVTGMKAAAEAVNRALDFMEGSLGKFVLITGALGLVAGPVMTMWSALRGLGAVATGRAAAAAAATPAATAAAGVGVGGVPTAALLGGGMMTAAALRYSSMARSAGSTVMSINLGDPLGARGLTKGVANPLTKSGRTLMGQRSAAGLGKFTKMFGAAGKTIPLMGAALGGYMEYDENKDISRAITRGAAGGLGTMGGAAAGAAIGSLILPVVGTFIGGLVGGIAGYLATDKVATVVHDYYDTDFTAQQAAKAKTMKTAQSAVQGDGNYGAVLAHYQEAMLKELKAINVNLTDPDRAPTPVTMGDERIPVDVAVENSSFQQWSLFGRKAGGEKIGDILNNATAADSA